MLRRQALSAISFSLLGGTVLPSLTFGRQPSAAVSMPRDLYSGLQVLQTILASGMPRTQAVTECQALTTETLGRLHHQQPLSASFCQSLADAVARVADSADVHLPASRQSAGDDHKVLLNLHQQLLATVWALARQASA